MCDVRKLCLCVCVCVGFWLFHFCCFFLFCNDSVWQLQTSIQKRQEREWGKRTNDREWHCINSYLTLLTNLHTNWYIVWDFNWHCFVCVSVSVSVSGYEFVIIAEAAKVQKCNDLIHCHLHWLIINRKQVHFVHICFVCKMFPFFENATKSDPYRIFANNTNFTECKSLQIPFQHSNNLETVYVNFLVSEKSQIIIVSVVHFDVSMCICIPCGKCASIEH